ncbi:hypothetical protein [Nitratifractor salsuginis]|uniref:Uncharacterized protein n=1 Tax=Nitratifractor salsuginis (strain DSM 16511 / JCM 12458 / E9I37-1) TaxID=749222 RepID=E6WZQ4_NITSE|nr:hypothetical protein [Nitratifractor salsuginis]ADV46695.1 hypothetical protein Nitsa_1446 [Nitratifractor salsuginis DSM 16511]
MKAKNNFKSLIDSVCDEAEEIIATKNENSAALISKVAKSIEEANRGDVIDIDTAFEKAKNIYRD